MRISIKDLSELQPAAARFMAQVLLQPAVIAFYGKMGAGKTTFVRALCEEMGIGDSVNSPTFSIVNEYLTANGDVVYHFDFYRINRVEEAFDLGFEDYMYSGRTCFIEWPELVEELLPADTVRVSIREEEDGSRTLEW